MHDPAVLRFALISGLIGFGAFCASYALWVWRRRNAAGSGREGSPAAAWRRWSTFLIVVGALSIALAVAVREVCRPEGLLVGDELYTVRAPDDDLRLAYLFEGGTVKQGEVLARLECPRAEAKVQELRLRCRRLEMERDALLLAPLDLDAELVRRHQNATATLHQLRASIDQLLPAHEGVVRQSTMERLSRLEKSARLEVDVEWYLGELKRLGNRQEYAQRQLARCERLAQQNAATESELDACREHAAQLQKEIDNVNERVENLQNEKVQVDESLREFDALTRKQQATLHTELEHARDDRAAAEAENRRLAAALAEDLKRAGDLRSQQLEQLRLKIEEGRAELAGAEQTLVVRAPFDGVVVYRDPSPRSADEHQPLFVLGRQSGFRMRLRLPRAQVTALEKAGEVTIELVDPAVEPYFGGRFLQARALPRKPRYVVADLACHPPRETVRELVEGEKVASRLLWRPPLMLLWPFQVGAVVLILGTATRIATAAGVFGKRRRQKTRDASGNGRAPPGSTSPLAASGVSSVSAGTKRSSDAPVPCAAKLESGSVAAMLELLGARLREAVLSDEVDEDLIGALEWALDRHHVRAVRRLRAGLDCDGPLEQRVGELLDEAERPEGGNGNGHLSPRTEELERVLRVLRTVDPRLARAKPTRC